MYAPDREEHLLRTLERKNSGPMLPRGLRSIYREILSTSRAFQRPLQIACLGEELSNAWMATRRRFGSSDHYQPVSTLSRVLAGLYSHKIDVAVVDRETLVEYLWRPANHSTQSRRFAVCGDIILPVDKAHNGRSDHLRDVYFLLSRNPVPESAYSKTVVIIECISTVKSVKDWQKAFSVLKKNLLHAERIQTGNGRAPNQWLIELKGHWESESLVSALDRVKKYIRQWAIVGSYPEVPSYA